MKIVLITLVSVCMLLSDSLAYSDQTKLMKSPDGKFNARITSVQKTSQGPPEFIIEMIDSGGKLVTKEDFTSEDGEHGLSMDKAEWTPDSRFFIFTTYSSGGHMAWQFPAFFFSVADRKVYHFSDYLPPVAESSFSVKKPDIVTMAIWTPMSADKMLDNSIILPITFRMSDLLKPKHYFLSPNKGSLLIQ